MTKDNNKPVMKVDEYGDKIWYLNDKRHREDGPAVEYADGSKEWYLNGKLHREDGPACEYADGSKCWFLNGDLHRVDGPAYEWADGSKEWYLNDKFIVGTSSDIERALFTLSTYLQDQEVTKDD